jgi:hypothetical protein
VTLTSLIGLWWSSAIAKRPIQKARAYLNDAIKLSRSDDPALVSAAPRPVEFAKDLLRKKFGEEAVAAAFERVGNLPLEQQAELWRASLHRLLEGSKGGFRTPKVRPMSLFLSRPFVSGPVIAGCVFGATAGLLAVLPPNSFIPSEPLSAVVWFVVWWNMLGMALVRPLLLNHKLRVSDDAKVMLFRRFDDDLANESRTFVAPLLGAFGELVVLNDPGFEKADPYPRVTVAGMTDWSGPDVVIDAMGPGYTLREGGGGDAWKQVVEWELAGTDVAVFHIGAELTDNLAWELDAATKRLPSSRVLVIVSWLVPVDLLKWDVTVVPAHSRDDVRRAWRDCVTGLAATAQN